MNVDLGLAQLLVQGGIGLAIIKGVWELGKVNTDIKERLASIEKDVDWLRQIVGTRNSDSKGDIEPTAKKR